MSPRRERARVKVGERLERRSTVFWVVAYLALSAFLASAAWPYLENFPPISADEVWIVSASYKLADEGVFGSDLFAGFYGSERHYLMALPMQHVIQAAFFKAFGAGLRKARAPSLLGGVVLLCAVGWIAYRWVGLGCSLATGVLLVFWRSNLMANDPRPPLLALAQSGRYDITVVSLWWCVFLMLNHHLERPRRRTAFAAGFLAAITALTQFYGAGVLVCCAAALLWTKRRGSREPVHARDVAIGAVIPLLLYAAYVAAHWTDFIGQIGLHGERLRFWDPWFYLTNLAGEWRRFEWLFDGSRDVIGVWAVLLSIPVALVVGVRLFRAGNVLGSLSVFGAFVSLALLDAIKARIYASLLVPVLCFALAASFALPLRRPATFLRILAAGAVLIWIVFDGLAGYRFVAAEGPRVSRYADVGGRIAASLEAEVPILGSQRWWWALRTRPYQSLAVQWEIWKREYQTNQTADFRLMLEKMPGAYLILDNDTRGDLTRVPPQLRQQVNEVLSLHASLIASWRDHTYGLIEIYRSELTTSKPGRLP
jgi:hypothetical protein